MDVGWRSMKGELMAAEIIVPLVRLQSGPNDSQTWDSLAVCLKKKTKKKKQAQSVWNQELGLA